MVDNNPQGSANVTGSAASSLTTAEGNASKWEPYWDETYKRYYWSDGNESVRSLFFVSIKISSIRECLGLGTTSRLC